MICSAMDWILLSVHIHVLKFSSPLVPGSFFVLCSVRFLLSSCQLWSPLCLALVGLKAFGYYLPVNVIRQCQACQMCLVFHKNNYTQRFMTWLLVTSCIYSYLSNYHSSQEQTDSSKLLPPVGYAPSWWLKKSAAKTTHVWRCNSICAVSSLVFLSLPVVQWGCMSSVEG